MSTACSLLPEAALASIVSAPLVPSTTRKPAPPNTVLPATSDTTIVAEVTPLWSLRATTPAVGALSTSDEPVIELPTLLRK